MMKRRVINTANAPAALGPYSQAIVVNGVLFSSGQLGMIPETGEFAGESASAQAEQAMKNLSALLNEAGTSMANVNKSTIFLKDISDFAAVNEVYAKYFTEPYPARSCVQAAALPKDAKVEIEVIASIFEKNEV